MDDDDLDFMDDWSETAEGDASDTWDDFDDESTWGADDDEDDEEFGDELVGGELDSHEEDDELDEEWDVEIVGGGGAVVAQTPAPEPKRPHVSALEFGAATAVAGWLLDQQADRLVEGVRRASVPAPPSEPAWQRLEPVDPGREALPPQRGDILNASGLVSLLGQRFAQGEELALEATRRTAAGGAGATTFTMIVTHLVDGRPIWVLFPEQPGGFSMPLLQPVFADQGPPGVACCFTDSPGAAVAVVRWGLQRYGLVLEDFAWTGGF